jgi:F-type H+-transporting ATPase subunit delta
MSQLRIARRYATALLQLAVEQNIIEAVEADITLIQTTADASPDLRLMFRSPVIDSADKVQVLKQVFGASLSPLTQQFLVLITEKGRDKFWREIISEFQALLDVQRNIQRVTVTSAAVLESATRATLVSSLEMRLGKVVQATFKENSQLLGGAQIEVGDQMLDGTLRHQLTELRQRLAQA